MTDGPCQSCGDDGDEATRFPDGRRYLLCYECTRQWQLIWRYWCQRQPRQADRVRAQANQRRRARADGGVRR